MSHRPRQKVPAWPDREYATGPAIRGANPIPVRKTPKQRTSVRIGPPNERIRTIPVRISLVLVAFRHGQTEVGDLLRGDRRGRGRERARGTGRLREGDDVPDALPAREERDQE